MKQASLIINLLLIAIVSFSLTGMFAGCANSPADSKAHTTGEDARHSNSGNGGNLALLANSSEESALSGKSGTDGDFLPMRRLPYEELEIPVMDSVKLYARLYDPYQEPEPEEEDEEEVEDDEEEPEPPSEKYPLIILLHALNGDHGDWDELPARLVHRGYAVVALDMRGHGQSAKSDKSWRNFSKGEWERYLDDALRVAAFFDRSEDYPQVDSSRVGIIGASIGANTALLAGARDNATENRIKAVVALSAGQKYKGLETTKAIYRYKNHLMMVASQNDQYAFESTKMLHRLHTGTNSIKLYRNIGHGTDMIRFFPKLQENIADWLLTAVPPTPAEVIYPDEDEDDEDYDEDDGDDEEASAH